MKKFLIPIGTTLILLLYLIFIDHESYSSKEMEFSINKPYLFVVKSLSTKNSLEKMVEEDNGYVTNKNWENFTLEVPQRVLKIRDYKIEGILKFTVHKNDKSLGQLKLPFVQEIKIDNEAFLIKTNLTEPQQKVIIYEKIIELKPINEETVVFVKNNLKIKRKIPFFLKNYMDKKVQDSNEKDLDQIKENIIKIINSDPLVTIKRSKL
jgi:hypothetical protein